jgi:hypothetical protein
MQWSILAAVAAAADEAVGDQASAHRGWSRSWLLEAHIDLPERTNTAVASLVCQLYSTEQTVLLVITANGFCVQEDGCIERNMSSDQMVGCDAELLSAKALDIRLVIRAWCSSTESSSAVLSCRSLLVKAQDANILC